MSKCNRCHQAYGFQGDSWCIACAAWEQLGSELNLQWGTPSSREIATDLLVSGVRQIRALRRVSLGGAGYCRASSVASVERAERSSAPCRSGGERKEVGQGRTSAAALAPGREKVGDREVKKDKGEELPGLKAAPKTGVKSESGESYEEEEEEGEESEESEDRPRTVLPPAERSPVPRRRSGGSGTRVEQPKEGRGEAIASERRERQEKRRGKESARADSDRGVFKREEKRKRKRHGPGSRGGRKHQRHYRALDNPYQKLHYKPPQEFWDQGLGGSSKAFFDRPPQQ